MINIKLAAGISMTTLAVAAAAIQIPTTKQPTTAKPNTVTVVQTAPVAAKAVAPAAKPVTAARNSSVVTAPALKALPPLDLSDMALWNWNGKWTASQWGNPNSPIAWVYDHIKQPAHTDTLFTLDANGAPELQSMAGTPAYARGLWEADVTLPKLHDGVVVAPLWLYDSVSRDEVDFELAGRNGLDLTVHASVNGTMQQISTRLFAGQDLSGQRKRFGIKVDETAGYIEMYVDGVMMKRWDRGGMSLFVSHPMKPEFEMWAANPYFASWVGTFAGFAANDSMVMNVHGYGYTAIP